MYLSTLRGYVEMMSPHDYFPNAVGRVILFKKTADSPFMADKLGQ